MPQTMDNLKVISINHPFSSRYDVTHDSFDSATALFDYDVVVIRPPQFTATPNDNDAYRYLRRMMSAKAREVEVLLVQGGVLVIFLDVPDFYKVTVTRRHVSNTHTVSNYDFVDPKFAYKLTKGSGTQVKYQDPNEPFAVVLKKSEVAWATYCEGSPDYSPLSKVKWFASAGAAGGIAGKTVYMEGHIILLPLLRSLDEDSFFEACSDYRFKRQGTPPPEWTGKVFVPGLPAIEAQITSIEQDIANLQVTLQQFQDRLEDRAAYRKLLYEKGKSQLEPIVLRALDDLEFVTSPGETIKGTIHEIDGRTKGGSSPGIIEVKGSKNAISQSEFALFVPKVLADAQVANQYSKGILVGNGFCETAPQDRLGDKVFTPHALDGAKRTSVALINSVELYWLCSALLEGKPVDKSAVREAILTGNGYVDLKPFCTSTSPFGT